MELEIWEVIKYIIIFVFTSGAVIEFIPVKFSPISALLAWFGDKLNKKVQDKISLMDEKIDKVQSDFQSHKVESQRRNILNFADELMQGQKKTRENFNNIINLHDKYEVYIKENNIENGQIDLAFDYIIEKFKKAQANNDFL